MIFSASRVSKFGRTVRDAVALDARKHAAWRRGDIAGTDRIAEAARRLRRDGFVLFPDFRPREWCTEWARRINAAVPEMPPRPPTPESPRPYTVDVHSRNLTLPSGAVVEWRKVDAEGPAFDKGVICIYHLLRLFPELADVRTDPTAAETVARACGEALPSRAFKAFLNRSVTDTRSYHVDNSQQFQYKAFLFLTDVSSRDDGAHSYVTGSNRPNVARYANYAWNFFDEGRARQDMRLYPRSRVADVLCPAGTLMLVDVTGFHCGLPQAPGRSRVVIVNCFDRFTYG